MKAVMGITRHGWLEAGRAQAMGSPAMRHWLLAATLRLRPWGEFYFARHVRHATGEMAALAADVRGLLDELPTPCLDRPYVAIKQAVANPQSIKRGS
jgi:hypothetical protein